MKLIDFPEAHIVIAENQPEYLPMGAYVHDDQVITCCWKLSFSERLSILFSGQIWHSIWTSGKSLQPQRLDTWKPTMYMDMQRIEQRKEREVLILKNKESRK